MIVGGDLALVQLNAKAYTAIYMSLFFCCKIEVLHTASTVYVNISVPSPNSFGLQLNFCRKLNNYTQFSNLSSIYRNILFLLFWLNSWHSVEVRSWTFQIWDDIEGSDFLHITPTRHLKGKVKKNKAKFEMLLMGSWLGAFINNFWYIRIKFVVQMHISAKFQVKYHGSTELQIVGQNLLVLNFILNNPRG